MTVSDATMLYNKKIPNALKALGATFRYLIIVTFQKYLLYNTDIINQKTCIVKE